MMRNEFKKKGFLRKIAAGLAAFAMLGTAVELPAAQQTVYAEEVNLPAETNTSFAAARELVFGSSMAGTTPSGGGKRYFKFSLEQASRLDIELNAEKGWSAYTHVTFYDASMTEVEDFSSSYSSFSKYIDLTGGKYYMTVANDDMSSFSFVVNVNPLGESFPETQDSNNDMASDASVISLKQKYKGVLAANDDIDYFKFQVPAAGKITFNMTNSVSSAVQYGIYDESVNPVYTNTVGKGSKVSQLLSIQKGTYYLAIAKLDVNEGMGSYTFTIDYTKKNTVAPKLKSVKNSSARSMTVKWSQVAGASGYELWYSTKSNFKSGVVKKDLGSSVTSATYSGLKKNKTYYVRIRAYEVINDVKEYGKWSAKNSVVIKK